MMRRYAITFSLPLLMLCHCAPSTVPTADQCEGDDCPNVSTDAAPQDDLSIPPAAATGLADRLRPIEPSSTSISEEPIDMAPMDSDTIDPFTEQLLNLALLSDLLPILTDSFIMNINDPGTSSFERTFLEQSCRNQGIEDFICRQRYGS